jgi:hypothetical protein
MQSSRCSRFGVWSNAARSRGVPLGRSRVEEAAWRMIVAKYCATFPAKIGKDLQVIASNHVTAYFGDFVRCHRVQITLAWSEQWDARNF